MNQTVEIIQAHRSDRSYKPDPIPDDILDNVIKCAHLAPTSKNSQEVSVVVVRDAATRKRIAEITGQPFIAQAPVFLVFVADLYKTGIGAERAGIAQQAQHSVEGIIGAVTDVGISLATAMIAARSYGLGIVPIGSVRKDPQPIIELLELPKYTFPVNGLAIGYVKEPAVQKPRLPIESFRHDERYHPESLGPAIADYDVTLPQYWKHINRPDGIAWSKNTAGAFSKVNSKVKLAAAAQGFTCED